MKERGIIFNGEMVRAIQDGRKTQTRRPITPQPSDAWTRQGPGVIDGYYADGFCKSDLRCPFGVPGDRLWVRETFIENTGREADAFGRIIYRATFAPPDAAWRDCCPSPGSHDFWRPSIHMPRWASRITLDVTDVRVERVKEIGLSDCMAEGVGYQMGPDSTKLVFMELWDSIYAKRGQGWSENPWVWVVSFKRGEGKAVAL